MKLIFSRKGFDSSYGGSPSPILPGIGPASFPIPSTAGSAAGMYKVAGLPLEQLLSDLTGARHDGATTVHLDPDLDVASSSRRPGWRPALGQVGAAQAHLSNRSVGPGDLFLFFGWFRPAERVGSHWQYAARSASFHALFGWLQVGSVLDLDSGATQHVPAWLADHPHVTHAGRFRGQGNVIYVATEHLQLGGHEARLPGGGAFRRWSEALKLTAEGASRSVWRVPSWLAPTPGRAPLSYHGRPERWEQGYDQLRLHTVAKGQEFVLDCRDYPEAAPWARNLIAQHSSQDGATATQP